MVLVPLPAPRGFRPPLIPFFRAQLIDGEEFAWNVDRFGAVALVWSCSFKKQDMVVIAGKIGPFYDRTTGIWRISDAYVAAQQGLAMETFISRNAERPWARRDVYGFKFVAFLDAAPACSPSLHKALARGFVRSWKDRFFNPRLVLNNPKRLNILIQNRVKALSPLPPLAMLLPMVSKGQAKGVSVPVCLALRLPTLIKAIRARACMLSAGYVDVSSLDASNQQSVLGDLVCYFTYEPLRAALCGVSAEKCVPGVPEHVCQEALVLMSRLKRMRRQSAARASQESARHLPLCLLNAPFENKQRFQLANILKKANATINPELVETLSDGDASRIKQFQAATKWAARHTTVHTPSCRGMGGRCKFRRGFEIDTTACAQNIAKRCGIVDLEDLKGPFSECASPAAAIAFGIALCKKK